MADSAAVTRNLEQTPTWAVASVCFGIISVSIIIEHFIHLLTQWVKKLKKKSLEEAVEKLKSELMLLGFISLILAVLRAPFSSICIPSKYADIMLPCPKIATNATNTVLKFSLTHHVKKTEIDPWHPHRLLATDTAAATATCANGKVPLITIEGIDQLHIFIFVLAATQLVCSLLTLALGRAKLLLVLGTKLEVILARMALQLTDQATVILGAPLVQPDDSLFWFSKPRFVLQVLHFTMFANAFEFAFSIWATVQFGSSTCLNYDLEIVIARLVSGVVVLIISSYITLPIYALVTQMGSNYKSAVLEEEHIASVRRWHERVKKKMKEESSSHGLLKISRPNSEMGSIRTTPLETLSSLTPAHHRSPTGLEETISPPWNEISEVEQKPGETNDPSGSMILELSALNGHDS
ncbi:hypothetical protein NE237_009629 [Protea cynaroides]|uniref:MLO-like protein n=1 Tax=Protea cynaroides TaxID=273540 RepID=A0A9Q0KYY7_9MAGN|nr:hypothetical protein NE237_009629 [Protea cynaroides]